MSTFLILSVAKVFDIFACPETVTSACAFITDVYNSFPTLSSSSIMHALGEAAWAAKKYEALGGWVEMKAFWQNFYPSIWPNAASIWVTVVAIVLSRIARPFISNSDGWTKAILIPLGSAYFLLVYLCDFMWVLTKLFSAVVPLAPYSVFGSLCVTIYWCFTTLAQDSIIDRVLRFARRRTTVA